MTISEGEFRNAELEVTSDGDVILFGTAICMYIEGTAVSIQTGGSFTVSTSQLIHGETTDPFPCNGANMACSGPHDGSVVVDGPSEITTAAPLVCDEGTGECQNDPCMARFGDRCANGGRCDYGTATCVCPGCDWVGDTCERRATEADILLKLKVGGVV